MARRNQQGPTFDAIFEAAVKMAFSRTTGKGSNAGNPPKSYQLKVPAADAKRSKWTLYRWLETAYSRNGQQPDINDMRDRLEAMGHTVTGDATANGFTVYRIGQEPGSGGGSAKVAENIANDYEKMLASL